jgi:DNA-binding beta-propeller fold protein YncE
VSQYSIGADGVLVPNGTPIATGAEPNGITADPSGRYVYTANINGDNVSQYSITNGGAEQGQLALLAPAVPAGVGPAAVVVDPTGSYAYVANCGVANCVNPPAIGSISEYTIGPTGALLPGATAPAGVGTNDVVIAPGGAYLYAVNAGDNTVSAYAIADGVLAAPVVVANAATALTPLNEPQNIAFDGAGHAYVTNAGTGSGVAEFLVAAGGALTPLGTIPAPGAEGITVDKTGKFVYVTDRKSNPVTVYEFSINRDGTLTEAGTVPLPNGTVPTGIVTAY